MIKIETKVYVIVMASLPPSLCQHSQCDAFQFTICRHCQLFLCIKHLAEHQQQFPTDFQRLLDDARKQQAQLSTFDPRISEQRSKYNQTLDNEMMQHKQLNTHIQFKTVPDDMRSCLARFQQTSGYIPVVDKIGQMTGEQDTLMHTNHTQSDRGNLFTSFTGLFYIKETFLNLLVHCFTYSP